jgi:hypothetical protein
MTVFISLSHMERLGEEDEGEDDAGSRFTFRSKLGMAEVAATLG